MTGWISDLLLIEVVVGANLLRDANVLHVKDFGTRELVSVLDGALADLLVANGHAHHVGNGFLILGQRVEIVTLVGVLVAL